MASAVTPAPDNKQRPILTKAPPRTIRAARSSADQTNGAKRTTRNSGPTKRLAHSLKFRGVMLPPGTVVHKLVATFVQNQRIWPHHQPQGQTELPGNRLHPHVHYNTFELAVHAADRAQCVCCKNGELVILAVTVDDFCVAATSAAAYKRVLADLRRKYAAKDLGRVKRLLGWSVRRLRGGGIHISQPYLAQRLVDILELRDARPCRTPYVHGLDLSPRTSEEPAHSTDQLLYARSVGILRYLVDSTRPDLAYIAAVLARGAREPTARHWRALVQVARYVKVSTCAAEYIAASNTAQELQWLREVLQALLQQKLPPCTMKFDNTAAIAVARKCAKTKRSKYISVRHHLIRDKVEAGEIALQHEPTATLAADALTKPLGRERFHAHRRAMGMEK
eukprot:IDg10767t1